MIFIFDFDDTLFCIKKLRSNRLPLFEKRGIPREHWYRDYFAARKRGEDYSPLKQYKRLEKLGLVRHEFDSFKKEFLGTAKVMSEFRHDGTKEILQQARKNGHRVIILTKGFPWYQRWKVENSGLAAHVDEIITTRIPKSFAIGKILRKHKNERVVYIEDSHKQITEVKLHYPEVFVIQSYYACCRDSITLTPFADVVAKTSNELQKFLVSGPSFFVPRVNIKDYGIANAALMAGNMLQRHKIISVPTETSYGLAADATSKKAVSQIYKIKNRDESKRIPFMVRSREQLKKYVQLSREQELWLKKYENKTVSFLMPKTKGKLDLVGGVGRKATHPFLRELAKNFDKPFTITSTNISGQPSIYGFKEYEIQFKNHEQQVDAFFDYGTLRPEPASTILDITQNPPQVLRQGRTKINVKKTVSTKPHKKTS